MTRFGLLKITKEEKTGMNGNLTTHTRFLPKHTDKNNGNKKRTSTEAN